MGGSVLRCLVTGHDNGRATFVSDGPPAAVVSVRGATIWRHRPDHRLGPVTGGLIVHRTVATACERA